MHDPSLCLLFRAMCQHLPIDNFNRHALQTTPVTRPPNAFPRRRLVGRAVRGADKKPLVLGEKLVIYPIHRHWNVAATVYVGVEFSRVTNQDALERALAALELKLFRGAVAELFRPCDKLAFRSFSHACYSSRNDKSPVGQETSTSSRSIITGSR